MPHVDPTQRSEPRTSNDSVCRTTFSAADLGGCSLEPEFRV